MSALYTVQTQCQCCQTVHENHFTEESLWIVLRQPGAIAAVDLERLPGDEGGFRQAEEADRRRHVGAAANAADGDERFYALPERG